MSFQIKKSNKYASTHTDVVTNTPSSNKLTLNATVAKGSKAATATPNYTAGHAIRQVPNARSDFY